MLLTCAGKQEEYLMLTLLFLNANVTFLTLHIYSNVTFCANVTFLYANVTFFMLTLLFLVSLIATSYHHVRGAHRLVRQVNSVVTSTYLFKCSELKILRQSNFLKDPTLS